MTRLEDAVIESLRSEVARLKDLLRKVDVELYNHANDYHHVTSREIISAVKDSIK